jgi:glycosyltransferase involved in cell wall biosynthesis
VADGSRLLHAQNQGDRVPLISVVAGCYNEQQNVRELWERLTRVMADELPGYDYEIILIDNASTDRTVEVLRGICREDRRVKVIVNNRNFGHIRSGYYAMQQASGAAVVSMASDLQDPPEMVPAFVRKWEEGYRIVLAQKTSTRDSFLLGAVRKFYYGIMTRLSEVPLASNVTGFGLYDRRVIDDIKAIGDPYPYFRGMICELGYERHLIPFEKPSRKRGISSNNFYTLYDLAMLGIINHSKVPLRLAVFAGCTVGVMSMIVGFAYLIYKLLYWNRFQAGAAPVVLGIFFLGAVQLFFIGILGEYIGSIHTQILRRPLVTERERINFD